MAQFRIKSPTYEPHPAGRHQGRIIEVRDLGMVESQFGAKHKVAVIIESSTARLKDGLPAQVQKRMTLSSHPKAPLRLFREAVLDRQLTKEELLNFDGDAELVDRRISYRIDHSEPDIEGRIFGNIRDGSVEPLESAGTPQRRPAPPAKRQPGEDEEGEPDFGDVPPPEDEDGPLPF